MTTYRVSFQLYSARKSPPVEAQLEVLADIGFDAVEPYRGAYGDDPAGFRQMLDRFGLACPTAHIGLADLDADRGAVIETARILGLETVIVPAIPTEQRSQDVARWKALADNLAGHAAALGDSGLKLAWHNHDFEYVTLADGTRPIDQILSASGVLWEPDLGWIIRSGSDIVSELARYRDRITAFHIKDLAPEGVTADDGWANVGAGTIDWTAVWPSIAAADADLLVLEHDNPSDWRDFAVSSYGFVSELVGRGRA